VVIVGRLACCGRAFDTAGVGSKGLPTDSVYSATKAAIRSFARTWTTDLKDRRIRVNAVSPGPIDTPGLTDPCLLQKRASNA
jgi:NAD(P)-dependent dehydrogenase (short-subunit alcohol dehydrogenase family)